VYIVRVKQAEKGLTKLFPGRQFWEDVSASRYIYLVNGSDKCNIERRTFILPSERTEK
jgi:hypothetical protein